jgi:hypothetical protein
LINFGLRNVFQFVAELRQVLILASHNQDGPVVEQHCFMGVPRNVEFASERKRSACRVVQFGWGQIVVDVSIAPNKQNKSDV